MPIYYQGRKHKISKQKLERLYCDEKLSIADIARKLAINKTAVQYIMQELNIPRRSLSEACKLSFQLGRRKPPHLHPPRGETYHEALGLLTSNPHLTLADVARELKVTRERVRQIAGDIPGATRHKEKFCSLCGIRIYSKPRYHSYTEGYCRGCYDKILAEKKESLRVRLICEGCGKELTMLKSYFQSKKKRGQKRWFCNRTCMGRWLGRNFGFNKIKIEPK